MDGLDELLAVAPGQVSSPDGACEEGISGQKQSLLGKIEADAAFSVAGGMEDGSGQAGDGDDLAVFKAGVGWGDFGGGDAKPSGLNIHHLHQRQVILVVEDRRSGKLLEALRPGDVVDMGVGNDDLFEREMVLLKGGNDPGDVVAGIDHDGLVGDFIAQDGAVALQRAYDENFVDHGSKTNGSVRFIAEQNEKKRKPLGLRFFEL